MRKLYRVALLAAGLCFAVISPPAVADIHDHGALSGYVVSEPVISARDDVIAVPEVASIPNGHEVFMRDAQAVAGAPVLPAVADPERTCQSPAFASPTDHAVIRHTETFKTAADGRHGVSWRLQGRNEGWNFGEA